MSFASILSGPTEEQPARKSTPPPSAATPQPPIQAKSDSRPPETGPVPGTFYHKSDKGPVTEKPHPEPPKGIFTPNGVSKPAPELASVAARAPQRKPFPPGVDAEQVNRAMLDIDNGEKSDVEGPGFEEDMQLYMEKGRKRLIESYRAEQVSRKVSFIAVFSFNF